MRKYFLDKYVYIIWFTVNCGFFTACASKKLAYIWVCNIGNHDKISDIE